MANRVFNYEEINRIYSEMNKITGDGTDFGTDTIAGLLQKIDDEYHCVVQGSASEDETALVGDLGKQMLLNWENTSATFPSFVDNFNVWSTVVAQAAGEYSSFEAAVQGIRSDNPLGWNSKGITDSYTATSSYANALTEDEIADYAVYSQMLELTNATYVDTGMVAFAKAFKKANMIEDIVTIGSILTLGTGSVIGLKGAVSSGAVASKMHTAGSLLRNAFGGFMAGGASTALVPVSTALVPAGVGVAGVAVGSSLPRIGGAIGGLVGSHIIDKMVPDNTFNFTDTSIKVRGTDVTIGGQDYKYYGHTSSGIQILCNQDGDLVYQASDGSVDKVRLISGAIANVNKVDEETELVIQETYAGCGKDLVAQKAYNVYYDTILSLSDELESR